jgi:hypothetical protein
MGDAAAANACRVASAAAACLAAASAATACLAAASAYLAASGDPVSSSTSMTGRRGRRPLVGGPARTTLTRSRPSGVYSRPIMPIFDTRWGRRLPRAVVSKLMGASKSTVTSPRGTMLRVGFRENSSSAPNPEMESG